MLQLTYIKKNRLEWWDVPEPVLQSPGEAIVRPFVAARCDGDPVFLHHNYTTAINAGVALHYLDPIVRKLLGKRPFQGPYALGHECIAQVIACGDRVTRVRVGQFVIVPWAISCGACSHCGHGLTSSCLNSGKTLLSAYGFGDAMGGWGGAVSDLLRVPYADAMLVSVPEGVDPVSLASASDNIPDAWRTVAPQLKRRPGANVLVVGGGARSIALYAAGIAVALGASAVDYVDDDRDRLEIAESLGANAIDISASRRSAWFRKSAPRCAGTYPITVDASAEAAGLNYAIRSLSPGGECTSVGYYFQKATSVPLMHMYVMSSTLRTGVSHPRADLPELVDFIKTGKFKPEKVTTLRADWRDAADAFLIPTTKVVVTRAPLEI